MKKVLITGATGFVGKHLIDHLSLKPENFDIVGTSLNSSDQKSNIKIEQIDLSNYEAVRQLFKNTKPDYVYHLAALTSTVESFNNPTPVVLSNIEVQMNILNALKDEKMESTRLLTVSSAEAYGYVNSSDLPIDEETPLRPMTPYAVSKLAQDFLSLQYYLAHKLDIVRVRPFNHTGPSQTDAFAIPSFAKQIAMIEKGKQEPILKVGNLSAKRDFTDVRDIVKAYELILEKGIAGEVYNLGSGNSKSIKELLDVLLSFSISEIKIEEDPTKLRPIDVKEVYCDNSKITSLTGWMPTIPIEKTLKDTLDYWRNIV